MKTRTSFRLGSDGVVRCWCGHVVNFAEDLNEFIVPMLDGTIKAEFNGRIITVSCWDNTETIRQKFMDAMKC